PARPIQAVGHLRRGNPVRRVQGRRLLDAGGGGRHDRHRRRRPVAHRVVHRGPAPRAGHLPAPHPGSRTPQTAPHHHEGGGGKVSTQTPQTSSVTPDSVVLTSWKAPIALGLFTVLAAVLFIGL